MATGPIKFVGPGNESRETLRRCFVFEQVGHAAFPFFRRGEIRTMIDVGVVHQIRSDDQPTIYTKILVHLFRQILPTIWVVSLKRKSLPPFIGLLDRWR